MATFTFLVSVTLVVFALCKGENGHLFACPHSCKCESKTYVICDSEDVDLTYIPRLPASTTELVFRTNSLGDLYRDNLTNITLQYGVRIEKLDLSDNGITSISTVAFSQLKYLKVLNLSSNFLENIDGLQKALVGLKYIHLQTLILQNMELKDESVPTNLFEPFRHLDTLQEIDLSYNGLNVFDIRVLANLTYLRIIKVQSNRITIFESSTEITSSSIEVVDFRSNNIIEMPLLCFQEKSVLTNLSVLLLDDNFITYLDVEDLNCLTKLTVLSLNQNPVDYIPSNLLKSMPSLRTLFMSYMLRVPINVAPMAFTSQSLTTLTLAGNKLTTNIFVVGGLQGLNALTWLDLSGNEFQNLPDVLETFFPSSVRSLFLRNCRLRKIPKFSKNAVQDLDLSENRISSLTEEDILGFPKLKGLNMNSNRLTRIDESAIPAVLREQLLGVSFGDNPLACSCAIVWMQEWLNKEPLKFLTSDIQVQCVDSQTSEFILLDSFKSDCGGKGTLLIYLVVGSVVSLIIAVLVFCYRKKFKMLLYISRRNRRGDMLVIDNDINPGI